MRVPLSVSDYLACAETHGDRPAVVDEPDGPASLGTLSYREFLARARGMALALDRMGVGPGDRVAIVSPNSARFLIAFFGVIGFGRVLVPVNFRLNVEEVTYIVEHSGASLLLVDPELAEPLSGVPVPKRIVLDGIDDAELFAPTDAEPEMWGGDEDGVASINYTSGTTARPKGVEMTHRNIWLNAATFGWYMGVSARDVYLHTLPMFHCNGWGHPFSVTVMGGCHVVQRRIDGEEILRRVDNHGVTFMCGAPAVVAAILDAAGTRREQGREVPGGVRMAVAGAPPPSQVIVRMEAELGWEFVQLYGLTETSPLLTVCRTLPEWDDLEPEARAQKLVRAGHATLGVRIAVDDEGEVLARSNHVFAGYWRQPEETAAALRDGWFHTGDGGRLEGPYLSLIDRKKDVIISGGENVSSIEVEDCLYRHPAIKEVAVIGVPDEKWGETVKALVVLNPGAQAGEREIIDFARGHLAHYKCPTSVEFRDALLRTATGKLQKFRLREPYWQDRERGIN
jgi:acyl-CoA synthetase (AMP-forming)/AMP-acid ligase II